MGRNGHPSRRPISRKLKDAILIAQTGRCAYCNAGLDEQQIQWDHFIPFAYVQANYDDNWVAACAPCNNYKGSRHLTSEAYLTAFCLEMVKLHGSYGDGWPEGPSFANLRHSEAGL